ncbi:methyltransferase domain-containing protein [Spongisporangium articulatum]|uniref:Methyltransferase domain-containing protein n=1 Tax=Spongisporangium articulatum TaxID=3362603 RepID=A0ABW8ANK3_9ACTN
MGRHERIAELAELDRPGLEIADFATGMGRTVRAMLAVAPEPTRVHAIDSASSLDDEILHDARVRSVIADLDEPLPFPDSALDRAISLNVAEHLADPAAHLAECYRVLKPGGVLVFAHSDWDTALFASPDDVLTRTLVDRFVSVVPRWAERADGFMGRKLLGLALSTEFELDGVHTWADCHRRFDKGSVSWKVAMGVLAAAKDDPELTKRATAWVEGLATFAAEGRFLFSVTDVAVVLRKPAAQ